MGRFMGRYRLCDHLNTKVSTSNLHSSPQQRPSSAAFLFLTLFFYREENGPKDIVSQSHMSKWGTWALELGHVVEKALHPCPNSPYCGIRDRLLN